jgi:uncharacterized protein YigA (DUF484 family)
MKSMKAQRQHPEGVEEAAIEAYLRAHPDFFHQHLDLLESLKVPHPCGDAVSLVSRQLDLLRERNRRLQVQLNDILQIARDNDSLARRIHQLTLALLDATSVDDALGGLRWLLHECFQADFVAVRLLKPVIESPIADLSMPPDCEEASHFRSVLESGKPECGRPTSLQAGLLFGGDAHEVRSYALIPLHHAGLKGLLAIGSRNASRFDAAMGHLFLNQLGEIVAARLVALLQALP